MIKNILKKILIIFCILSFNMQYIILATEIDVEVEKQEEQQTIEGTEEIQVSENAITNIEFKYTAANLAVGQTTDLKSILIIEPVEYIGEFNFSIENETIATVDYDGIVTGIMTGQTKVIVETDNNLTASIIINVTEPINEDEEIIDKAETEVSISDTEIELIKGEEKTITVSFNPETAKEEINWKTSDETIANVDENGNVTGINEGTAIISAILESGKILECNVTVKLIHSTKISLGYSHKGKTTINLYARKSKSTKSKKVVYLKKGKTVTITSTSGDWYGIQYKSGSKTYNGYIKKKYISRIANITLKQGNNKQLVTKLTPNNSTDKITYTSSKTSVAIVDSDGNIVAKKKGTATITAKTSSGKSDYVVVKVTAGTPVKSVNIVKSSVYTKVRKKVYFK